MNIVVTLREILHKGDWDKFCQITGTNEWCIQEGLATGDEKVTLTVEQAHECKLI